MVAIFDSLPGTRISSHLQKQINRIYTQDDVRISYVIVDVQRQPNGEDCGLYAIAVLLERKLKKAEKQK